MITGAVKNKVDKIWLDIFSAGLANPLTVIEQLTYLMFIRALDAKELENENYEALGMKVEKIFPQTPVGQSMRWSRFKNKNAQYMFDIISQRVFPAIKEMKGRTTTKNTAPLFPCPIITTIRPRRPSPVS